MANPVCRLQPYRNRHGGSGVRAWAITGDTLSVEFVDGAVYDYRRQDIGPRLFTAACAAARAGRGLSSCISRHLRQRYATCHADRTAWVTSRCHAPASTTRRR
ncbi:hypothetical protein [Luteimonas terrae]|uniref:KTSC domain-containing protein n=1 Tax=Luteimonas terrae TaxID=1530191 RepID=A0ABU1XYC2_9GAMM|nr:hypothetical protein [Luteimonas terrae]MDR7193603.1 hypothetical protein [Luteimonas terrae]